MACVNSILSRCSQWHPSVTLPVIVDLQPTPTLYRLDALSQTKIDQLTHELAVLRRCKFGKSCEQLAPAQASVLDEAIDGDIAAIEAELEQSVPQQQGHDAHLQSRCCTTHTAQTHPAARASAKARGSPRTPTPPLARPPVVVVRSSASARMYRAAGLHPGPTVERHVRGKWACVHCQTLIQAPVPAQVIDKGIPTSGLLAQVLVAKYVDHLPLYRQEAIFGCRGGPVTLHTGPMGERVRVVLQPLVDALKTHIMRAGVLHADADPSPNAQTHTSRWGEDPTTGRHSTSLPVGLLARSV